MTTFAAIFGTRPIALGTGAGTGLRQSLRGVPMSSP
jgi:multidrug efflux pump subunit AcrB